MTPNDMNDVLIEINGLLQMAQREVPFNANLEAALKRLNMFMESDAWGRRITMTWEHGYDG